MKNKIFFLIAIALTILSCKSLAPIVVSPDNSLFAEEAHAFFPYYYADFFSSSPSAIYLYPEKDFVLKTDKPVYIKHNSSYNLYKFYPGDSVVISQDKYYNYHFKVKNNDKRNTEIKAMTVLDSLMKRNNDLLFSGIKTVDSSDIIRNMDIAERKTFHETSYLPRLKLEQKLNQAIADSISNVYAFTNTKKQIRDYVDYYSQSKMYFPLYAGELTKEQELLNLKHNIHLIDSLYALNPSDNFQQSFLLNHNKLRSLYRLQSTIHNEEEYLNELELIKKYFKGPQKEYAHTDLMERTVLRNFALNKSLLNDYFKETNNKYYKSIIKNQIAKTKETNNNKTDKIIDLQKQAHTLDEVLGKHRGKIILIDIWATWCIPCIEEFPHGKKLLKNFDEKEFVIIYLSTDKNKNTWTVKSNALNLPPDKSYALENYLYPALIKDIIKSTIPQYILIGKDGKIISSDAPRPSEEALREMIKKNL